MDPAAKYPVTQLRSQKQSSSPSRILREYAGLPSASRPQPSHLYILISSHLIPELLPRGSLNLLFFLIQVKDHERCTLIYGNPRAMIENRAHSGAHSAPVLEPRIWIIIFLQYFPIRLNECVCKTLRDLDIASDSEGCGTPCHGLIAVFEKKELFTDFSEQAHVLVIRLGQCRNRPSEMNKGLEMYRVSGRHLKRCKSAVKHCEMPANTRS
jgi:hypothetical protein